LPVPAQVQITPGSSTQLELPLAAQPTTPHDARAKAASVVLALLRCDLMGNHFSLVHQNAI
jgi:hypothetical protein